MGLSYHSEKPVGFLGLRPLRCMSKMAIKMNKLGWDLILACMACLLDILELSCKGILFIWTSPLLA